MSDVLEVPTVEFRNCINIPNRQTEKLNEQIARNKVLGEENIKLKEEIERKETELAELRETLSYEESRLAPLEEWMKIQIKEVRLATDRLNDGFMTAYKTILEKLVEKSQTTSSSDRKRLAKEIQEMEDVCEDISKDAIKTSVKCLETITFRPNRVETLPQGELNDKTENLPIESFLGEFTADENTPLAVLEFVLGQHVRTIILRKCFLEDYFEVCWKFDNGKEHVSLPWIPDNIERKGLSHRIEKNVLIRVYNKAEYRYVLQDNNLTFRRGCLYTRRDVNHEDKWPVTKINNITTKNMPIEAFLGEFAAGEDDSMRIGVFGTEDLPIRKVIIQKANQEGYFKHVWKSGNGKERVLNPFKPDNVERNGEHYRIERNVLIYFYKDGLTYYELTDQGLKMDGNYLHNRV